MNPFSILFWLPPDNNLLAKAKEAAEDAEDALGTADPLEETNLAFHVRICAKRYIASRRSQRALQWQMVRLANRMDASANRGMFVVLIAFGALIVLDLLGNPNAFQSLVVIGKFIAAFF